jgi:hypothetical protein
MNGQPTRRDLYDAIGKLHAAMLHGFTSLEARIHEFDEDAQSFRLEVHDRFERIDRQFPSTRAE